MLADGTLHAGALLVSPEHAERLDLKAHARPLVVDKERDLGTRLE
jgi:hypothetical protein